MEILYLGLFVEKEDLLKKLKEEGNPEWKRLSKTIEEPHVTIYYKPADDISFSLFGKEVEVEVYGYGNNGKNEGLFVRMPEEDGAWAKIKQYVDRDDRKFHITVSHSEESTPKETENIEFEEISKPFRIRMKFGGMDRKGKVKYKVHPKKGVKYIVPFFDETYLEDSYFNLRSDVWQKKDIRFKYLTQYISEIFTPERRLASVYTLNKEKYKECFGINQNGSLFVEFKNIKSEIDLCELELYRFVSGVNFIVYSIEYEAEDKETLNNNYVLSFLLAGRGIKGALKKADDRIVNVMEDVLKKIIPNYSAGRLFENNDNKKCFAYHRMYRESESSESVEQQFTKEFLAKLSKGFNSATTEDYISDDAKWFPAGVHGNRMWVFDSNSIVSASVQKAKTQENGEDFIRKVYQGNVDKEYFVCTILALQERECYLHYNAEAIRNMKNPKKLKELKKEILKLSVWTAYNVVSTENKYQTYYEKVYAALGLDKLENDVEEIVSKLNENEVAEHDRKLSIFLAVISVLAVVSTIKDAVDFVERCYGDEAAIMFDQVHVGMYAFFTVGIMIAIYFLFKKKD